MRHPARNPARPCAFAKVRPIRTFGCASSSGRNVAAEIVVRLVDGDGDFRVRTLRQSPPRASRGMSYLVRVVRVRQEYDACAVGDRLAIAPDRKGETGVGRHRTTRPPVAFTGTGTSRTPALGHDGFRQPC